MDEVSCVSLCRHVTTKPKGNYPMIGLFSNLVVLFQFLLHFLPPKCHSQFRVQQITPIIVKDDVEILVEVENLFIISGQ
jgi:hypothetical protein